MADHHDAHDTHDTHDSHGHDTHGAPPTPLQDNATASALVVLVILFTLALVLGIISLRQPLDESARLENTNAASAEQTTSEQNATEQTAIVDGEFDVALAYAISCSGCHGMDGKGVAEIENSTLEGSALLNPENRADFFAFLTESRQIAVDASAFYHPIRGEYPGYTDAQLEAIIDYVYTLN